MNKWFMIVILVFSGLCGFFLSYYLHLHSAEATPETIQTFHYPVLFVKQLSGDKNAGQKIFNEFCSSCHSQQPRIDIVAPRIGDANAWKNRRKLGIDVLLKSTIEGKGAMPARGGCFECSDEQLRATILYMLSHVDT